MKTTTLTTRVRAMARDPTARWGAAAFAAAGLGFGWLTLGRALTVGHLLLAVPLWVELAEGG